MKISNPNTINELSKIPENSDQNFDSRAARINATKSEQEVENLLSYQNTSEEEATALDASQTQNTAIN